MTIENKDPTTTVESVETIGKEKRRVFLQKDQILLTDFMNKIGFNMKQARDDSSDLAKKPIEQCGLDDINNNNNKNGPSSMDLEKSATCDTIVTSSTQSDEDLTTRQQEQTITAYLSSHDCVVVIIMASSIIDKDTTIKGFQQNGYNVLQQQSMKLSDEQIDILYAYDEKETKLHYRQLFDGWKKSSQSDQVQVVVLEKENAVQSFLSLVTNQNSTKKKNRMMDPQR
ncbi:uncharacterized protein BX664DRAFT_198701 [Halteromyces radiatus]|uniref:uncharacterized protein n=1 Tax=Halteromyces radiatus TaxID=101107 RepID=UPI00221FD86C|nr:uncharacterized protein BX664DRAFT_198701 [Halteromyces radiatus]KAI8081684.1 hypothetical protein BX664DRAFT_198701 [Halteromyces radiatus]